MEERNKISQRFTFWSAQSHMEEIESAQSHMGEIESAQSYMVMFFTWVQFG